MNYYSYACMSAKSFQSDSLRPFGAHLTRLLCPWGSPGKNTGVGCHALLQVSFSTLGSKPYLLCLLHWQESSLPLGSLRSPITAIIRLLSFNICTRVKSLTYPTYCIIKYNTLNLTITNLY